MAGGHGKSFTLRMRNIWLNRCQLGLQRIWSENGGGRREKGNPRKTAGPGDGGGEDVRTCVPLRIPNFTLIKTFAASNAGKSCLST